MLNVRSRIGVVAVATSAAVLLAVPVVAAGQVPGVDQVVGGVTETAESLVPAPASTPLPAPAAPAPAQRPAQQSSAPAPAAQAPAAAPSGSAAPAAAPSQTSASGGGTTGSRAGGGKPSASHAKASAAAKGGAKANAAADDGAKAGQADEPTDVEIADQAVELPGDASPSTLPFTGLQLALMAMVGLAAIAGGMALRRGVRERRA